MQAANETTESLVNQIKGVAIAGLDALNTREDLVLKMREIYSLAVLANVKASKAKDSE